MNRFMFHSLEFIKTDEVIVFGSWGDYSVEIKIDSGGVEVFLPDFDNDDPTMQVSVRKIFKEELLMEEEWKEDLKNLNTNGLMK